jgi:aminopeptidase N
MDRVLASLAVEKDEQITQLLLGQLQTLYWKLLSSPERGRRGPGVELALWRGAHESPSATLRSSYFAAWRGVVESADGLARMRRLWAGEETAPVPLAEADRTRLAVTLALREVEGWRQLLEQEEAAIENPDRRARFAFSRSALSADPADRERFFQSLADPANREREPWVLEAVALLHHPLRAGSALGYIRPSLDLLPEIQATGDIFFPLGWATATLGGHSSPEAAAIVRGFLEERTELPPRLRGKLLQDADPLLRAARMRSAPTGGTAADG